MKIKGSSRFWNLHSHSRYSANDALPTVTEMVATVEGMRQPAMGLTDHGNMAGSVELYRAASRAGIRPFPGSELYIVPDRADKKAKRHHICVVAFNRTGYRNLVQLSTLTHKNFHHKPLIDLADIAELGREGRLEGIAATSGCYFGLVNQAIVKDDEAAARRYLGLYASSFDRFYIELQNHNIDHGDGWTDDLLADRLVSIADEMGLPCVLTQDAHYCHEDDRTTHETMKRLVAYGDDADDAVFPGDGFHLADAGWMRDHHEKRYERGIEGLTDLLEAHDLSIPELDNYSYNVPHTTADPQSALAERVYSEADARGLSERHRQRISDELAIIEETGMAGYLMLVAQVTDWCRDNRVFYQARGSASGSILCWLLHITQADPIKHGLLFERFISKDRTKPPDIDLDVEHTRRQELLQHLEDRYAVHQIGTWMEFSIEGNAEGGKGSLRTKYFAKAKRAGREIHSWADIPDQERESLLELGSSGAMYAYGVNAAGVIVTSTQDEFDNLVPLMRVASSKSYVSQYDKDDSERLGLVKLDVLGVKTLTVLNKCMKNLGRDVQDGLDWIPLSDGRTYRAISKGDTEGVFQLEGFSSRSGVRRLKPTKLSDVIASMALFRKATMGTGATDLFIARRHGKEDIPDRHSLIEQAVGSTMGIFLYQEQVMTILRSLGMGADDLTAFLKAIKASNSDIGGAADVIRGYRDQIEVMCRENGFSDRDFEWLWESFEGFSEYGFNKSHAVAYGLTAYRCAYLSVNHPVEFFAALLNVAAGDEEKETTYVRAARRRNIPILSPDVNMSGLSYEVDTRRESIRKGLLSIKGVGQKIAERIVSTRGDGFESMDDFCRKVGSKVSGTKAYMTNGDVSVGVVGLLNEAGALRSIHGA